MRIAFYFFLLLLPVYAMAQDSSTDRNTLYERHGYLDSKSFQQGIIQRKADFGYTAFPLSQVAVGPCLNEEIVESHLPMIYVYGGKVENGKYHLYVLLHSLYSGGGYGHTYEFDDKYILASEDGVYHDVGRITNNAIGTGTLTRTQNKYCIEVEYGTIPDFTKKYRFTIMEVHNTGLSVRSMTQQTGYFYLAPNKGHWPNEPKAYQEGILNREAISYTNASSTSECTWEQKSSGDGYAKFYNYTNGTKAAEWTREGDHYYIKGGFGESHQGKYYDDGSVYATGFGNRKLGTASSLLQAIVMILQDVYCK